MDKISIPSKNLLSKNLPISLNEEAFDWFFDDAPIKEIKLLKGEKKEPEKFKSRRLSDHPISKWKKIADSIHHGKESEMILAMEAFEIVEENTAVIYPSLKPHFGRFRDLLSMTYRIST